MEAYGRVRFVLLCTVCILKLASYDNIVMASIISPSGKLDLVVFFSENEKECDEYSWHINLIFIPVLTAVSPNNHYLTVREKQPAKCSTANAMIEFSRLTTAFSKLRGWKGRLRMNFFHCFDSRVKSQMAHLEYSGLNFSNSSLVIFPDIAKLRRNHQEWLLLNILRDRVFMSGRFFVAWKREIMSVMQNYWFSIIK